MPADTYYRTVDQLLLAKPQAAIGAEENPTSAADAVKVGKPQFSANFDQIETNYVQSSLSRSAPMTGGGNVGLKVPCWLRGANTAGQAPDYGDLLRGCAMSETLTAADVTGTAQAGGASTITLAVGAGAVDNAYQGMVIELTGGTGSGQKAVIASYVGATKVATVYPAWGTQPAGTTTYAIRANALYRPISSGVEVLTLWAYQHRMSGNSRRRRLYDAVGSFQIGAQPRGVASLDFTFQGRLPANPDDVAKPSAPAYIAGNPPPLLQGRAYLGGAPVKFSDFSFDIANQIAQFDDLSDASGYDVAQVIERAPTGRITPNLALVSSRDAFSDWRAGNQRPFWLDWGAVAGQRISLFHPAIQYTGWEEQDVRGFAAEALPFRSVSPDGEIFMCIY